MTSLGKGSGHTPIEPHSGATLDALNVPVQRHQVPDPTEFFDLSAGPSVVGCGGGLGDMHNFDHVAAGLAGIFDRLFAAELHQVQTAELDYPRNFLNGLVGKEADDPRSWTPGVSNSINDYFRFFRGDAAVALRHENHPDEICPCLSRHQRVF